MGYSAKFASQFYGPFRYAADSAPKFGDRRDYQLDYVNSEAAINRIEKDINEGADIVMVKPALSYLDIIHEVKRKFNYPLAAYNVSGEYAMVKIGKERSILDEKKMVHEILASLQRAGANFMISYHTKEVGLWKKKGEVRW